MASTETVDDMNEVDSTRRLSRLLRLCWAAIGAALGLVLLRAGELPDRVPAYVSPLDGSPTAWAPGVLPIVIRVPLMGAGLLLVVSALALGAPLRGGWSTFFGWLAIALTVKTCLETISLAVVGTSVGETVEFPLHVLTLLVVTSFVIYALDAWRRGRLITMPSITGLAWLPIVIGLAIWMICALLPSFY